MAGLPNATFIGFTGTPVDKTVYGKGTFKTFGCEDDKGYLHKYSIAESIEDGTTLPLYYQLAPNEMLVPHEIMEKEFLALAATEGIADIEAEQDPRTGGNQKTPKARRVKMPGTLWNTYGKTPSPPL
jgi:type I restriction enzyme R subunit